jgi:hypothetical protein
VKTAREDTGTRDAFVVVKTDLETATTGCMVGEKVIVMLFDGRFFGVYSSRKKAEQDFKRNREALEGEGLVEPLYVEAWVDELPAVGDAKRRS